MDIGLQVNASVPISVPEFLKENVTSYVRAINEYINELRKIGRKVPEWDQLAEFYLEGV